MAVWTTPITVTVGQLMTATIWNAQVRDNFNAVADVGDLQFKIKASAGWQVSNIVKSGWLEANGAMVSRTTYASLYTALQALARTYGGTTTLSGAMTNNQTSVPLTAWPAQWPADGRAFEILIGTEKILITAGFGTTSPTCTRAAEGTVAATHSGSDAVSTPTTCLPFGDGDGLTTFTLPDFFGGRNPLHVGSHSSISVLGVSDNVTSGNRRPQHRHTPHSHSFTVVSGTANVGSSGGANPYNSTTGSTTGSADGGSGVSTDSLDAPAHQVAGIYIVKF
jgi:microcystin-dependent protein